MHTCHIHTYTKILTYFIIARSTHTIKLPLTGSQEPSQHYLHATTRDNVRGLINRIHGILKNRERKITRAGKLEF